MTRTARRSTPLRLALLLTGVLALASCARVPGPDIRPLPSPLAQPVGNVGAVPRTNGGVGATEATPPAQIAYGRTPGAAPAGASIDYGTGTGDITLDFADTDIREVVNQILGTMLRVSYTIDPNVHGTATFHTARPLPRSQLLPTLQTLLAQSGATLVQNGSLYRVVPATEATTAGVAGSAAVAGSVVVPLGYASADALAKLLQPFAGGAKIAADPGRNAVLIAGEPNARAALTGLVESFDTNQLAGQSYALLPVATGDAKDFATAMQDALRGGANAPLAGLVRVIPLERLSAVLVAAEQPRYIDAVRRIYDLVQKQRRFTVRTWHVYYLQNSHAEDAAYVLQQAFTPQHVTAQPTAGQTTPGGARQIGSTGFGGGQNGLGGGLGGGGLGGGGLGGGLGGGGLGGGLGGGGLGGGGLGGGGLGGGALGGGALGGGALGGTAGGAGYQAPAPAPAGAGANPLLGGLDTSGGTGGAAEADTMRIIPNDQNNALLVYATPQEESTIEQMLRKIDILPLQVRIDAVIAEVTLNDALQYGTQYFFKEGDINQTLSTNPIATGLGSAGALAGNFPGFVLASTAHNAAAAISALQNVTTVNVLSSPELLVLDNQLAHLQVGANVPYLSSSAQSTIGNSAIVNQVQYQPTGVILDVTPRVNSGGLVTLDISQDVSSVAQGGPTTAGLNSPTFNERNVVSRVVVQDGQTIGLAGLIQENVSKGNSGIPWLKDIPLLGLIAGSQNNTRTRTELLVLITPHVVHDQRDAEALTEDLREQLPNAALLPTQLNGLPLSGSPDPSQRLRRRLGIGP